MNFEHYLKENTENKKPDIFTHTTYDLPTEKDLEDINNSNLTAQEIFNGFSYTIIGRGFASDKNKKMIFDSINMLMDKYPDNEKYKEVLTIANKKYNKE